MKIEYPVNIYRKTGDEIVAIPGSMSPWGAKCQYCGEMVTATQIKYGDGRGVVYSLITEENPKPVILDRAYHHYCISTRQEGI